MWTFFQVLESKVMNFTMPQILDSPQILHGLRGCQPWKLTLAPSRNEPFRTTSHILDRLPKHHLCKCQTVSCCGRNLLDDLDGVFFTKIT